MISSDDVSLIDDAAVNTLLADIIARNDKQPPETKVIVQICVEWIRNRKKLIGVCMPVKNTQLITTHMITQWLNDRLKSKGGTQKAILAQVGTGEGKSVIIAIISIYIVKVLKKSVHIMVNNIGLLERDYASFKQFYANFEITSSNNVFVKRLWLVQNHLLIQSLSSMKWIRLSWMEIVTGHMSNLTVILPK